MTAASLALWLLALDGSLTRVDGAILCLGGVAYTAGVVWTSRKESAAVREDYEQPPLAAISAGCSWARPRRSTVA